MKSNFKIITLFSLITLFLQSCSYNVQVEEIIEPPVEGFSFATDIQPIFESLSCTSCHSGTNPSAGLDLSTDNAYSNIVPDLINTDSPDQSVIYTKALSSHMGKQYSSTDAQKILGWITEGAKDN